MNFKGFEKIGDVLICNLLFLLCSIPIFTVGAAATAMQYALRRSRAGEGSAARDFFSSFRMNFRQATIIWLILLVLLAALGMNFWLVSAWQGSLAAVMRIGLTVVGIVIVFVLSMVFPLLAQFDNSVANTLKNSLMLSLISPVRSLAASALNLAPVALAVLLPNLFEVTAVLWTVILCGTSAYLIQMLYSPLFNRLIPQQAESGEEN